MQVKIFIFTYLSDFESLLIGFTDHVDVDQVPLRCPHIEGKHLNEL